MVYISMSTFASLVDISKGIMCYTVGLNIWAIIARIKKLKSTFKKNKKKHNKIAFLATNNLDSINGSIFRSLTSSYINRDYFLLIDVPKGYDGMNEEIKNLKT